MNKHGEFTTDGHQQVKEIVNSYHLKISQKASIHKSILKTI